MAARPVKGERVALSAATYYIGIDGGGTKTAGALADASGAVLAASQGGRSAIVGAPCPESCAVLQSVATQLCDAAGVRAAAVARFGLGLNGIDFAEEFPVQHAALARALAIPPDRLILVNDGIAALWGATPAPAAVILQHGTGFTAAYRSACGNERLFDHLDVGRCYDLRAEALALVARMIDGRVEATPLKARILACLDQPPEDRYAEIVFRGKIGPTQWARLLPAVFAAGEAGDPAAAALIERAAADYVCAAGAMIRKTGHAAPDVAFGGGRLALAPEWFMRRLSDAVLRDWPGARVRRPELTPAVGAAIMAAFSDGCPPSRFFGKDKA